MTDEPEMPILHPVPGTAPDGMWRIGNIDRVDADARLGIFPIVKFYARNAFALVGTGFYVTPGGLFATAAHVAREMLDKDGTVSSSAAVIYVMSDDRVLFRPIGRFFFHPTADVALAFPFEMRNERTDELLTAKVFHLTSEMPSLGTLISTWSYPAHLGVNEPSGDFVFYARPTFYNGELIEHYPERGPSVKLAPPYYQTNIHLYGSASGGPVFEPSGKVIAVASSSYEGVPDVSFITPATLLLDIEIECTNIDTSEKYSATLKQILASGQPYYATDP